MDKEPRYQNHAVFGELDHYIAFYKDFAQSVYPWVTMGTKAICGIDSYVYSSIQGTLASIRTILVDRKINDAYALLRKYYDLVIINIYSNLYLQDNFSIKNLVVEKIDNWLKGKAQLPDYRIMSQYIRSSSKVEHITALFLADDRYKHLRQRCNDHMHYNLFHNVFLNDGEIALPGRLYALDKFSTDVRDVLILHLAYTFFINDHYMMSCDHRDCLECGMTPEPDSQYWVSQFVQDVFEQVVAKYRPDIAATVKKHTSMHLE